MLDEYEFYQGAVLRQLVINSTFSISFRPFLRAGRITAFVVNGLVGLYVKHSSKRMSPWRFSFTIEQASDLLDLEAKFPDSFIVFVCETDGLVTMSFADLHEIVDFQRTDNAWISVARPPRAQYAISGNKAEYDRRVPRGIDAVLETIRIRLKELGAKYGAAR